MLEVYAGNAAKKEEKEEPRHKDPTKNEKDEKPVKKNPFSMVAEEMYKNCVEEVYKRQNLINI